MASVQKAGEAFARARASKGRRQRHRRRRRPVSCFHLVSSHCVLWLSPTAAATAAACLASFPRSPRAAAAAWPASSKPWLHGWPPARPLAASRFRQQRFFRCTANGAWPRHLPLLAKVVTPATSNAVAGRRPSLPPRRPCLAADRGRPAVPPLSAAGFCLLTSLLGCKAAAAFLCIVKAKERTAL